MDALEFALKTLSTTNQCASLPAFKDSKTTELEVVLLLVFKVDVHILTIWAMEFVLATALLQPMLIQILEFVNHALQTVSHALPTPSVMPAMLDSI